MYRQPYSRRPVRLVKSLALPLAALALPAFLNSCTVGISKLTKARPEIKSGATRAEVHALLGEPAASKTFTPPLPLGKDPLLHRRGAPLRLASDRRPASMRESFRLAGRYRKPGDPDGTGGLAQMSAKAFYLPEIVLGPFATVEWLAHLKRPAHYTVWYSKEGREIFTWEE